MKAVYGHMPTLRESQQRIAAWILAGPSDAADIPRLIAAPPRGDAAERLRVYAGGYPARLDEALRESFPATAHVLGDTAFAALVHRYIAAVPLASYNLNDAGAHLPRFLYDDPVRTRLPFLPDLAQLEWAVARAFHAQEQPPVDLVALADWDLDDWERAVLRLQPSVALVTSAWPVHAIWECRETPIADINIDLNQGPDRVLIRRAGDAVVCESLDQAEADALRALLHGQPLGAVIAGLTSGDANTVTTWFARWMALRLIAGCKRAGDAQVA